jgi:hypothetical protein
MTTYDVVVKRVEPVHVAQVRAVAQGMEQLGPTLDRSFDQAIDYIAQHGANRRTSNYTVLPFRRPRYQCRRVHAL